MRIFQTGDSLRADRYEIQRLLRSARDKNVYLARDRALGCQVAVDAFSNNNSTMPSGLTVSAWEARVLGQLGNHPNIATAVDYWEDDGMAVMVSRYLSGGTLRDLIMRSQESGTGLPIDSILRISLEIAHGLAHIHGQRILYRDLQPCNVLFNEWGTVHLVDFDTAVSLDDCDMSDLSHRPVIDYMAPELIEGQGADERADLYSLGATIYQMATGHPPCTGTREEVSAVQHADLASLDRDDLPPALRELIFDLLAFERDRRPASAADVIKRLESLQMTQHELGRFLVSDESTTLEFKASLRTPIASSRLSDNIPAEKIGRALEHEVLKTLAAFLNTNGGTLIIGVTDDQKIVGIEVDYPRIKKPTNDAWRLTFDNLVSHELGTEVMKCIDLQLEPWDGRTIAVVRCAHRGEPTWFHDDLFVRRTASTEKLTTRHAVAWLHQRSGQDRSD